MANSHAAARELVGLGYPSDRLRVVPNGVDVRRFPAATPAPHDGQLIATAARLAPQKDPETFLRAAALAARPGRRFAWFGVGPLREQVERRAKELGVDLLMPGVRQDMAAAYAEMDVFTLTSAWGEAFSNSFAEALASGLPCVVTDSGDHALAGEVATIVPPRDPAALAAAWDRAAAGDGPAWVRANLGSQMVARTMSCCSKSRASPSSSGYPCWWTVLGGKLAVSCSSQSALARPNPLSRGRSSGWPAVRRRRWPGSRATSEREPGQVRKEAASAVTDGRCGSPRAGAAYDVSRSVDWLRRRVHGPLDRLRLPHESSPA